MSETPTTHRAFGIGQPAPIIVEQPTAELLAERATYTIETHLSSDNTPEASLPLALVFGQLLQVAIPTVEHYHSDFFHDALWLDRNLGRPTDDGPRQTADFYYGFDECGTLIGRDAICSQHRKNGYQIHVERRRGWDWTMTATCVKYDGREV